MRLRALIVALVVAPAMAATVMLLRAAREVRPSGVDAVLDASSVPASALKVLSLGFRSVAADIQFMEAIQVYGDKSFSRGTMDRKKRRSLAVYRLLDYTTDFDPEFNYAYIFGADAIPVPTVDGVPFNLDETLTLLRKGIKVAGQHCNENRPSEDQYNCDWRIPFHLAYLLTEYRGDLSEAAKAMTEAARRPEHPEYLPLLATRLAAAGGTPETALSLCKAMYLNADTSENRATYLERCRLLEMEIQLRRLEDAATRFTARFQHLPATPEQLVSAGFLPAVPNEPEGFEYAFDAQGHAYSPGHQRLKLSDTTQREIEQNKERMKFLSAKDSTP